MLGKFTPAVARHVDVRHLPERMHPRIRAPRAVDDDARADDLREGFFQKILHPIPSRLALPAAEFPPVVGDEEFEPEICHGSTSRNVCRGNGNDADVIPCRVEIGSITEIHGNLLTTKHATSDHFKISIIVGDDRPQKKRTRYPKKRKSRTDIENLDGDSCDSALGCSMNYAPANFRSRKMRFPDVNAAAEKDERRENTETAAFHSSGAIGKSGSCCRARFQSSRSSARRMALHWLTRS